MSDQSETLNSDEPFYAHTDGLGQAWGFRYKSKTWAKMERPDYIPEIRLPESYVLEKAKTTLGVPSPEDRILRLEVLTQAVNLAQHRRECDVIALAEAMLKFVLGES